MKTYAPEQTNDNTARVVFARICLEIKADEPPPTCINYTDEYENDCIQEVIYEWMLAQWLKCKTFAHTCDLKVFKKQYAGKIPQNGRWMEEVPKTNQEDKVNTTQGGCRKTKFLALS